MDGDTTAKTKIGVTFSGGGKAGTKITSAVALPTLTAMKPTTQHDNEREE